MFEAQAAIHFFICGPQEAIICSMQSANGTAFAFACSARDLLYSLDIIVTSCLV